MTQRGVLYTRCFKAHLKSRVVMWPNTGGRLKFLINTVTAWDEPPRARHQVATALARQHEVYFVCRNRNGRPKIEFNEQDENLTLITPYWPVDYRLRYRIPIVNEVYQTWLFKNLVTHYKNALLNVVAINFDHTATRLAKYFRDVVYYCNDDHIGNGRFNSRTVNKYHTYCESKIIRDSKICIGTSLFLKDKLKQLNSNAFLITLGAPDISNVKWSPFSSRSRSDIIHVGMVGFINSRKVPVEVISKLSKHSNIRVTIVGPCTSEFREKLKHKYRITFKNSMVGEDLYREIRSFDVAIAPYVLENCNRGVTPNKLGLYLALGKPVVVSNLPNLQEVKLPHGVIYKANSASEFVELVFKAFQEDNETLFHKRVNFAKQNTWQKKIDELLTLIKHHLPYSDSQ